MDALFCCLFLLILLCASYELDLPLGPTGYVNESDGRLTVNFLINFNMSEYIKRATVAMAADDWTHHCKSNYLPDYIKLIDSAVNNRTKLDLAVPLTAPFTPEEVTYTTGRWRFYLEADVQYKVKCLKHVLYDMSPIAGKDQPGINAQLIGIVDTTVPTWMLQHFMEIIYEAAAVQGLNTSALGERYFPRKVLDPAVLDWKRWINSTSENVSNLSDLYIILAQCANQTFYYSSVAEVDDGRIRNGLFLWMVQEVLRTCCQELVERPVSFTSLVERIHDATVEKGRLLGANQPLMEINFIWNFVTNGWLLQMEQFFHDLDNGYGPDNQLFVTHAPSEDPISSCRFGEYRT